MNHNREVIIHFKGQETNTNEDQALIKLPTHSILSNKHIYLFKVKQNKNYNEVLERLQLDSNIISAEPNIELCTTHTHQNEGLDQDTLQWYLQQINTKKAWKLSTGSPEISIAVLDTGVNLAGGRFKNHILPGYDFVNDDQQPEDKNGHGTFVTGIIAADLAQTGINGLVKHIKILPVKVGDEQGNVTYEHMIEGVYYAIQQHVDIINMSYTGQKSQRLEKQALKEAYRKGITLVAASGNNGLNQPTFPASFPEVISVGASQNVPDITYNALKFHAPFSNYGPMIDIGAPGVHIRSLAADGGTRIDQGTSFAAPMVSSLAALLKAKHPTWSPALIEWAIEKGAMNGKNSYGFWEDKLGYGIIDMYESLKLTKPNLTNDTPNERRNAKMVKINTVVKDSLQLPGDIDWYQFTLSDARRIAIHFTPPQVNLKLDGTLYVNDREISLQHKQMVINLAKGTYQLKVEEYAKHWTSSNYKLDISYYFSDIKKGESHFGGIQWMAEKGIKGYPNGNFGVWKDLTRSHAAVMLVKALGLSLPKAGQSTDYFLDITDKTAYNRYITATAENGIFHGSNGNFMPHESLTREQMATIIVRALHLTSNTNHVNINLTNVDTSHQANVQILADLHITNQLHDFRPTEPITRGQFASFLYRAYPYRYTQ